MKILKLDKSNELLDSPQNYPDYRILRPDVSKWMHDVLPGRASLNKNVICPGYYILFKKDADLTAFLLRWT